MDEPTSSLDPAVEPDAIAPAEAAVEAASSAGGGWRGRKRYKARERPARARRRPGRRGVQVRDRLVQTRLTDAGYETVDTRSAQARLAMGAWLALIGEDVAHDRPALTAEQLEGLAQAAERLARIGKSLNLLAVGENVGRAVPEAQIAPALDRLSGEVAASKQILGEVAALYEAAQPKERTGGRWVSRGRRAPVTTGAEQRRERIVFSRVSAREHTLLTEAAARQGLSVGAWLGTLAEGGLNDRPAITGQQYASVVRVRKALRRIATNLAQIDQAQAVRGAARFPQLADARTTIDTAIRTALDVETAIAESTRSGVRG